MMAVLAYHNCTFCPLEFDDPLTKPEEIPTLEAHVKTHGDVAYRWWVNHVRPKVLAHRLDLERMWTEEDGVPAPA